MPVDFTQYQPPGVYIEEGSTPLVSLVGVSPQTVALVGPSVGYRTHTEAITLEGTTPIILHKRGIDLSSLALAFADGTPIQGADFSTAVGPGEDNNTGSTPDNTLSIPRNGTGITDGSVLYATYRYTDSDYFNPVRALDYDDVKDIYGEPLNVATGAIISPLSMAAKIAFENGARQLILVAVPWSNGQTTREALQAGYAKISALYEVTIVVPLPVGMSGTEGSPGDTLNVGRDLKLHCQQASDSGFFRTGFLGFEKSVSVVPQNAAASIDSHRVVLAYPYKMNYYNGFNNQNLEVAGYYLATAYAGLASSTGVQNSLTKKQINSFSGIPATVQAQMTNIYKNTLSNGGVAVTEMARDSRLVIRHGTTTDTSTIQSRELSLVRSKDTMVTMIQDTIDAAGLIGTPIDDTTPINIKGVISGVLERAISTDIIVAYNDLKVRQTSGDPTIIEVKFQYKPLYPLNYIVVSFSINTSTGETTLLAAA